MITELWLQHDYNSMIITGAVPVNDASAGTLRFRPTLG
jgi:hypothetical protein